MSVQIFCPFFKLVISLLDFKCSWYLVDISPLSCSLCKYFLPICALHFHSIYNVLLREVLIKSNLSVLSFMDHAFDTVARTHCPTKGHTQILWRFLLEVIVSGFIFRLMIHFELIFVKAVKSVTPMPFVEKKDLSSPLNWFFSFVKDQLTLCGSISGLCILFHWSVYSFTNTTLNWLLKL